MTTVEVYAQLAADRGQELRHEAAQARLVALVRCCRPSAWRRVLQRTSARVQTAASRGSTVRS